MPQCVFCDTSENLNTQLSISLDNGIKVTVDVCDEHSEDATVKAARVAYMKKQGAIQALIDQAASMGLKIDIQGYSVSASGLIIPQAAPKPAPAPVAQRQPPTSAAPVAPILEGEDVISTDRLDKDRTISSVGGSTAHGNIPSYTNYNKSGLVDKLPEEVLKGHAKMSIIEGRAGSQHMIPEVRVDGTGTTRLKVIKSTDGALQTRFKNMAASSMNGNVANFKDGYNEVQKRCPMCHGTCVTRMGKGKEEMCQKCNGSGIISIY